MLLQTYNHLSNWFSAILLISPAWSIWTTSLSTPNLRTHTIVWLDRFWNGLGVQSFMQILRSVNSTKTPWNVQINSKKLNTILNWLILTSIKEIQQFVGFCSFNWCIIHKYSDIIMPLQNLTHNSTNFFPNPLPPEVLRSFEVLKSAFTLPPVFWPFNPLLPSTLVTNASDFTMAGIHLQPDDSGLFHPCSFYSHEWSPVEINYDTYNKELPAIINCFWDM